MTSVLSTLNPLFEKNQTLTKSIYTSFNRSKRDGVKKDSANALVNTDETESLHYSNDNLVFDSTSGTNRLIISPEGNIVVAGDLSVKGVINGLCTNSTHAVSADSATTATSATKASTATTATSATKATTATTATTANGLSATAKKTLITELDKKYMPLTVSSMSLKSLTVEEKINGSIQKATDSDSADVAKGFTSAAKLSLQNSFDSRYLLKSAYIPTLMAVSDWKTIDVSPFEAKMVNETVTKLGTFTVPAFSDLVDKKSRTICAVYQHFYIQLRVVGTGSTAKVETAAGKDDGHQGITSLHLKVSGANSDSWDGVLDHVPLTFAVTYINKGSSSSTSNPSRVIFRANGTRFTPQDNGSESFDLFYYAANYTGANVRWISRLTYKKIVYYY